MTKNYSIKIALRGVSPMIWRRIIIAGNTSLAALHYIIQIVYGWEADYHHQFHIYGKDYGIAREGGMMFDDDPRLVRLDDFDFDVGDRFTYEYNFFKHWLCDIRIEAIDEKTAIVDPPRCRSGQGMPGATRYDEYEILHAIIKEVVTSKGAIRMGDVRFLLEEWDTVRFNRKLCNQRLIALDLQNPAIEPVILMGCARREYHEIHDSGCD